MKIYVLTGSVKKRLQTLGGSVTCKRCEGALEVGDEVVSRPTRPGGRTVRYHKRCYDALFADGA